MNKSEQIFSPSKRAYNFLIPYLLPGFYIMHAPLAFRLISSSELCLKKPHMISTIPCFENHHALKGILILGSDHENEQFIWRLHGLHGKQ